MPADLACSSFEPGRGICKDGFPVTSYCMGYTCHECGRPSTRIPLCLQDEIPERFVDEAGRMILRRRALENTNAR